MTAYYNEIDPEKAEWLRQLILAKVVAPGDVDERSISDVRPDDLRGYTQCHFFAGIGVWSYALRLAGWPDDREVWTGSCPCPSFSCAGKGEGFDDPRHLWPEWYRLIRQCRAGTIFGEQVNAAIGHGWLDLVCGDVEAEGYAIAAAVLGAHSAGAPHIRQRLYFVADMPSERRREARATGNRQTERTSERGDVGLSPNNTLDGRRQERSDGRGNITGDRAQGWSAGLGASGGAGECADTEPSNRRPELEIDSNAHGRNGPGRSSDTLGATRGFWADCDWWYGRDGKYRPIESGVQPLAHGITGRVLKLRGYGDAICAETAKVFIESYLQVYRPQST